MARNLDHRIEVIAPIENARVRQELNAILDSALADTTNAWELASDGTWSRITSEGDAKPRTHQETMMRRVRTRAKRRERDRRGG